LTEQELVEIHLLGVSTAAQLHASEHHDELFREFALIASRDPSAGHTVPVRLSELIAQVRDRFSGFTEATDQDLETAIAEGRTSVDLVFNLPSEVKQACTEFLQVLAEADEYCRHGDLLTLAPPADAIAFREWFLGEFVRQVEGEPPLPWPEYEARLANRGT
jgi:hypothetical protein